MEESKLLKVEVLTRETIKPFSPSPPPLDHQDRSFKLSLLDQFMDQVYIPVLLLYQSTGGGENIVGDRSHWLKSSLSETLNRFYPFAGRFKDHLSIICNDEGVEYSEAQAINSSLSDVLEKLDLQQLNLFIPSSGVEKSPDVSARPQFLVQVTTFQCGGMALGMKFCHKVADGATFTSFINSWANSSSGKSSSNLVIPDLRSASTLFPSKDSLPQITVSDQDWPGIRTNRFVFGPSELAALQAKATSINVPRPTRVEAVSAFLWRTALLARTRSTHWCPKPSALVWGVNLRPRLQPPLPEHCFGNLVGMPVHQDEIDRMDLGSVVDHLRHRRIDVCDRYIQILERRGDSDDDDILLRISELNISTVEAYAKASVGSIDLYTLTSWCKFPIYEADFGWGKPALVAGVLQIPNLIVLMDTRDGDGIEAWVTLMEEDMTHFESNQELQDHASFNPTV